MSCRWCFVLFAGLVVTGMLATAQPPIEPKDGKLTIALTVSGVAPSRYAMKYRLLPDAREIQTGNQVQAFYKCFFEQNHLFHSKESTDKQQKWMAAPLKELANEKELVGYGGGAVRQARYAARLDIVDWQLVNQMKSDGVMLLLPDVQQMRMLSALLKVRVRGEMARAEFAAAIDTLQIQFALARTFNEHPTLIGSLVGIALAGIALGEIEEFIQQPGAPNLFWSLMALPNPIIDLRKGSQVERLLLPKEFEALRKAVPLPEEQLNAFVKKLDLFIGMEANEITSPNAWYKKQAADKVAVEAARKMLAGLGHKAADLAKLSALQVLQMADFAQYEIDMDDVEKWTNVPFWQVPPEYGQKKLRPDPYGQLLPAYYKVLLAKARSQQLVALLTVVEGVRAFAGENAGKLPATLDVVKLPLPIDPVSGKPFRYEVKEGRAILRGTPPVGRENEPHFNRVYEITVRK